jgi:shikimate dehydrogenase
MKKLGLVGYSLLHSYSKEYFIEKFKKDQIEGEWEYELYPLQNIESLSELIRANPELVGLNVTIPYKISVLPQMDSLSVSASETGAVNTIKIDHTDGGFFLTGYNTDVQAFMESIKPLLKAHHKKALILGTGGAAHAIHYALGLLKIPATFVSRNPVSEDILSYNNLSEEKDAFIIINATPLGMYPHIEEYPPFPYHLLTTQHIVYDLIYNPPETIFLAKAKAQGATIKNGLEMLTRQADRAWNIWRG